MSVHHLEEPWRAFSHPYLLPSPSLDFFALSLSLADTAHATEDASWIWDNEQFACESEWDKFSHHHDLTLEPQGFAEHSLEIVCLGGGGVVSFTDYSVVNSRKIEDSSLRNNAFAHFYVRKNSITVTGH